MARSLSQTLIRSSISLSSTSSTTNGSRFANFRHRSNSPEDFNFSGEIPAEERENSAVKNLEEVINTMIVKKAEPSWIPFVPGASYWVPPKSKAQGFARIIGNLAKTKNHNYYYYKNNNSSLIKVNKRNNSNHGWPSSAHFFKGASHCPLEGDTSKHTSQSEDEEG